MALTINQLIQGTPSLGSYSHVIEQIQKVLDDPQSTLSDLGDVIEKDPDLTARLLKLGNSSYFGFPSRLETVSEAISLIGVQEVHDLLLASSVVDVFEGISADLVNMESFWKHSLACGIGARSLAISRQLPRAEKFFVTGFLHDLGRLVLLTRAPDEVAEVFNLYQSRKMLLREAEVEVLGFDHARVGGELMRLWQFPAHVRESIALHHQPMSAGFYQLESSLVHVADHLVHAMQMGNSGEHFVPPLESKAWERLGISTDGLELVMRSIDEHIEAVQDAFLKPTKAIVQG
jgi:HD-like signal output (HDOD) protein